MFDTSPSMYFSGPEETTVTINPLAEHHATTKIELTLMNLEQEPKHKQNNYESFSNVFNEVSYYNKLKKVVSLLTTIIAAKK